MKRFLLLWTVCTAVLCASASNRYVSPTGSDGDGKSWTNAVHTIAQAIWNVGAGDTMFIAEGVYNEAISAQSGATYLGGYNAETGLRDPELYESIIDGTDMTSYLLVKYDNDPASLITIDGLVFQNARCGQWDGNAVFMRGNMILNHCVFRNCEGIGNSSTGAVWIQTEGTNVGIVRNCLFENCVCLKDDGVGAVKVHNGGIIENCIIRNCNAGIAGVKLSTSDAIMRNCVLYNNHSTYNGCIYGAGSFYNNTVCNNTGTRYAGARVTGRVTNTVFWGNVRTGSGTEYVNYVDASSGATNNIADEGQGVPVGLATDNSDTDGPNFVNPTNFAGLPKNDLEREAMQKADFSLTAFSAKLIDQGDNASAPVKDIRGVARPKGAAADIGAYEYDPNAVNIPVTGVNIIQDTIRVIVGESGSLIAQVEPVNATNNRVEWRIDDATVATIKNGKVTGLKVDTTIARVKTLDGGFEDYAVVIVKPVPPKFYPQEVLDADANYRIEDYTIPSFIPFLVAKEEARIDSLETKDNPDIALIEGKLAVMRTRITELQPKENPYNQIATINGDPATHMGFCWFTNGGIKEGEVQLVAKANATEADFNGADVISVPAQTSDATLHYTPIQASESPKYDICTAAGLPRNTKFDYVSHKAQATTLQPGTTYSWRVGFNGHWSEIAQFVTKDEKQGNFSFVYMSDSHIQDAEYINEAQKCAQAVAKNESDVKFCVFPGDFVDTGGATNSEWQWEQWFEGSMRAMLNKMAVVPTDGNHDDSPSLNYDYHFNTDWGFANAAQTKPQFKGITYSFVYGDVLFLVYSMQDWWRAPGTSESGMTSPYFTHDLRNWFQEQIAKYPDTKYRVTLCHKNVFSGAGHHTDDESSLIRAMMLPIFKECGIDLAIQGHDHCYEIIGPVNPDTRELITSAVSGVNTVAVNTNTNMTGKEGGTFTTDDGTLYFIGATCGRKRYYPYSREKMEAEYTTDPAILFDYKHHNVKNLFDLFSSKFGQPGSPSYSRFNVTGDYIEIVTYKTDDNGNKEVFNTIRVKNSRPAHTGSGIPQTRDNDLNACSKYLRDGKLFVVKNGVTYNVIGQRIAR